MTLPKKIERDIIFCDDGNFNFWPSPSAGHGFLTAADLRKIADHLDQKNTDWLEKANSELRSCCQQCGSCNVAENDVLCEYCNYGDPFNEY